MNIPSSSTSTTNKQSNKNSFFSRLCGLFSKPKTRETEETEVVQGIQESKETRMTQEREETEERKEVVQERESEKVQDDDEKVRVAFFFMSPQPGYQYQQQNSSQSGQSGYGVGPIGQQQGQPIGQQPQSTSGLTAQTYSAYPEYDRQSQFEHKSFQNHSLGGWNDPPSFVHKKNPGTHSHSIDSMKSTILSIVTSTVSTIKNTNLNARLVLDIEKRMDGLVEWLARVQVEESILMLYLICLGIFLVMM